MLHVFDLNIVNTLFLKSCANINSVNGPESNKVHFTGLFKVVQWYFCTWTNAMHFVFWFTFFLKVIESSANFNPINIGGGGKCTLEYLKYYKVLC